MNHNAFFSFDNAKNRFVLLVWIVLTLFVFLLLFGPPELWWVLQKIGLDEALRSAQLWLSAFFRAG